MRLLDTFRDSFLHSRDLKSQTRCVSFLYFQVSTETFILHSRVGVAIKAKQHIKVCFTLHKGTNLHFMVL